MFTYRPTWFNYDLYLIKVTDFAEEKEILSTGNELEDAIVAIRNKQNQKTAEKLAREKELAKVGDYWLVIN